MDGVEPDDERYPDAPVPRHERAWRHPSEIGEATWRRSEPQIALGRGLLITTGAIGSVLALAVLWTMLPTGAGGGNAVSTEAIRSTRQAVSTFREGATSSTRGVDELTSSTGRLTSTSDRTTTATRVTTSVARADATRPDDGTASVDGAEGTGAADPSPSAGATTVVASDATSNSTSATPATSAAASSTIESMTQATIAVSSGAGTSASTAIAVVVSGTEVVLTTASAVRAADDTVTLSFDDGQTTTATVAMTFSGIAMLVTDRSSSATMKLAGTPHDGDTVTLLGAQPTAVALRVDAAGNIQLQSWGAADVVEGTPVVNGDGKVVALCSKGSNGPKLITIDQRTLRTAVDSTRSAGTDPSTTGKPYLGVLLNLDPKGSLTINAVDPGGPAAAAGIVAGDTVVSIDDTALASSDDLSNLLADHAPDDGITLTVQGADGAQRSVALVLAVTPARA